VVSRLAAFGGRVRLNVQLANLYRIASVRSTNFGRDH
jgi:hypothetical protein